MMSTLMVVFLVTFASVLGLVVGFICGAVFTESSQISYQSPDDRDQSENGGG